MAADQAQYETMRRALEHLLHDLNILAGNAMGPSGAGWRDVAGTASVNAQVLANQLVSARMGFAEAYLVFPDPEEALAKALGQELCEHGCMACQECKGH